MKILYYDCFSGISGDMNLGALIDLGVDQNYLKRELKKLHLKSYEIKICKDKRQGITGTRVDIIVNTKAASAHHDDAHHTGNFRNIAAMIKKSDLTAAVKNISLDIFQRVARAEAKIHSQAIDDVHFHEVGAIDSIVDIVGSAICLDDLKVDKVLASPVQVGGGFVKCRHGALPVP
ncbi:MAG: TIGR00299 family protein, partial [Deltaproteobacteria bacterium HGW-Deltaproteobacteria-7]